MSNKDNKKLIRTGSVFKVKPETVQAVDNWSEDQRRLVTKVEEDGTFQAHIVYNLGQPDEKISMAGGTHDSSDYTGEEERWSLKRCVKAYRRGLKDDGFKDVNSHVRMFELKLRAEREKGEEGL